MPRGWLQFAKRRLGPAATIAVGRPRNRLLRLFVALLAICGALVIAGLLAAGLLYARLAQGPLLVEGLAPRIAAALQERFGGGTSFSIAEARIERGAEGLELALAALAVKDASGAAILTAPHARMALDPPALLWGRPVPRWLEVGDVEVRLTILPDGRLAFAGGAPGDPAAEPRPEAAAGSFGIDRATVALGHFFEALAGPDSPLQAVERLGLTHGRLVLEDQVTHAAVRFEGVDLSLQKDGARSLARLSVDGPFGRWSARAELAGDAAAGRSLDLSLGDLSFDEIALLAGIRDPGFVLDAPLSAHLTLALDADGLLAQARGKLLLGAGLFKLGHRDSEPVLIDEGAATLHYELASGAIVVDQLSGDAGETHLEAAGTLSQPDGGDWTLKLEARPGGRIGAERPGEKPVGIGTASLFARLRPGGVLALDSLAIRGPDLNADVSGELRGGEERHMSLAMSASNMPLANLVRLWPSNAAAPARAWFLQHLGGGQLDSFSMAAELDAAMLDRMDAELPAPDEAIHMEGRVSNASLALLPGLALTQVAGSGRLSGRKASFDIQHAVLEREGQRMSVAESRFAIPDTGGKHPLANIDAHLTGSLEAVAAILAAESLKPYASLPLDPASIKGQIDGRLLVDLKLGKPAAPEDVQVRVNASISNFVAEKLVGKERLDNGALALVADKSGIRASGTGRVFGVSANVELKKPAAGAGEQSLSLVLDEAARAKHGLAIPGLSGPVAVKVSAPLGGGEAARALVELDLSKAAFDNPVPGLVKAAGRPAKASFQIAASGKGSALEDIVFDAGPASARGTATLGAEGGLVSVNLTQFKLSPGDDMKLEAIKTGEGMKLVLRGNAFDARAALQSLATDAPGAKDGGDIDLNFKSARVAGLNKQAMTGVELRVLRRGGAMRQFALAGKLGGAAIAGELATAGAVHLHGDNAGAFLAFIDLYKRMEGGDLSLTLASRDGRTDGQLLVHDFVLRDEPALRKLVAEGVTVRDESNGGAAAQFDAALMEFNKLQVAFTKIGSRVEFRDGVMYGPQIGSSLEGAFDLSRNFVDVKGTFVPAYGLNNLFARIPLLGPLLGGASHEGLFAINFRISGPASAPTLSVNPLSAIAPGFLRQIFGSGEIPSAFQPKGTVQ